MLFFFFALKTLLIMEVLIMKYDLFLIGVILLVIAYVITIPVLMINGHICIGMMVMLSMMPMSIIVRFIVYKFNNDWHKG